MKKSSNILNVATVALFIDVFACIGTWLAVPHIQESLGETQQSAVSASNNYAFVLSDGLWIIIFVFGSVFIWATVPLGILLINYTYNLNRVDIIGEDPKHRFLQFLVPVLIVSLFVGTWIRFLKPHLELLTVLKSLEAEFFGLIVGLSMALVSIWGFTKDRQEVSLNLRKFLFASLILAAIIAFLGAATAV